MSTDSAHRLAHGDVLVVEDSTFDLEYLSEILTEAGYRVQPAGDGELALCSVRAKLPDLILLDVSLPGMNGVEVCRCRKSDPETRDVPVIFISVLGDTDLKVKALEAGGADYVTKPLEASELLARVNTHLQMFRLQRRLAAQSEELIAEAEERKQAEERLTRAAQEWETTFDATNDAIFVLGRDQRILRCNKTAGQFFQRPSAEVIGKHCWEIVHGTEGPISECPLWVAKQSLRRETVQLQNGEGWFQVTVDPVLDTAGEYAGAVHIVSDIAERKQMEQEMIRLERLRVLGEMSAGVSHNLNNMLTAVLGPAQLLLLKSDDPEIRREAEAILTAGRRARDLVMRLGQAVRSDEGGPLEAVSLNERVREVVRMAQPRWKDEPEAWGVTIEMVTELAEVPDIRGNVFELGDAILNLLLNAVDALPEGGILTIATQAIDAGVQLTVSDTGVGMDKETCPRIFEPFFTTKMDVGSGLGLSAVRGTVTRWGGTIEVDSTPGQGTTFTLCFPAWSDAVSPTEPPSTPLTEVRSGKLLIVEDDENVGDLLDRLLSGTHTVEVVQDGREALDRFAPGRYDVVLIDLSLPGLSGDQIATQIRRLDPLAATVLITGWVMADDDPRVSEFDFRIQKPFDDIAEVEAVVARAVEMRRAGRA